MRFVKYPRTPHLPWSPGRSGDSSDRVLPNVKHFVGSRLLVTEKMDGENVTLYRDGFHARSLDSRHHPSRDWLARFWAQHIRNVLPENMRVCAEYLYAKHSIEYRNLPSYLLAHSVWEGSKCLNWDETLDWLRLIEMQPVPLMGVIHNKDNREDMIEKGCNGLLTYYKTVILKGKEPEGYVVRLYSDFQYDDFFMSVAKYVRKDHILTDRHWMHGPIEKNRVAA